MNSEDWMGWDVMGWDVMGWDVMGWDEMYTYGYGDSLYKLIYGGWLVSVFGIRKWERSIRA
jgi:hypothetical protein